MMLAWAGVLGLWCAVPACGKKQGSPVWGAPGEAASQPAVNPRATGHAERKTKKPKGPSPEVVAGEPTTSGLRFIAYNLQNWLTMDRLVDHKEQKGVPKPDEEKRAVVRMLARHAPDVIGVCEIGTREDLAGLQAMLQAAGLTLPHADYAGGSDEVRHLGVLSRFPIRKSGDPAKLEFKLNGSLFTMNRGILDVTIEGHGKPYRFLGVHLKSKRETENADQEALRFNEARLLRQHVDAILKGDADARLIVYGDFNDTRATPTLKAITGAYNSPGYLTAIPAQDRQGQRWTHFWELHDIYSRFDFITVSQALKHDVDFKNSRIIDDPEWIDASDHRPVMALFN